MSGRSTKSIPTKNELGKIRGSKVLSVSSAEVES